MKLVRENINEKFKEESDPITDMGIGIIPITEVKKFHKQLQNKFNDLFPAQNVNITLSPNSYSEDRYEIFINIENTGYNFFCSFLASNDAALKYYSGNAPLLKKAIENKKIPLKTGWYVSSGDRSDIEYVETTNIDKLIKTMVNIDIDKHWNADNIIQKHNEEIQQLTKRIEIQKINIDVAKTIEKILKSK